MRSCIKKWISLLGEILASSCTFVWWRNVLWRVSSLEICKYLDIPYQVSYLRLVLIIFILFHIILLYYSFSCVFRRLVLTTWCGLPWHLMYVQQWINLNKTRISSNYVIIMYFKWIIHFGDGLGGIDLTSFGNRSPGYTSLEYDARALNVTWLLPLAR